MILIIISIQQEIKYIKLINLLIIISTIYIYNNPMTKVKCLI